jgi:hypothetical protein
MFLWFPVLDLARAPRRTARKKGSGYENGSNLTRYFLDATRTQSSCEKSKSQRSAESRGFSPGTPVSSNRESWQGGLGKKGPQ